ncbi:YhcN/YlaJ family sporulation lipoprotein [Aquibacillus rhizosphaerae]|uniref:YhcN/YlaJ family sporulation lipoprotein n=1 Tax=Aquibacillus rhizosphaerae TaxID=3051431 RepID=A0ABT7L3J5_9BACI|nr:YhcN/YlaJ family sporulation lipoprotein [Aquibacillus sp. LR5S19]MDL4839166.1 YhcN/YlaJ family sporulation lipoprotein [Aquibacillus sp. LR5S19]
MKYRIVLFMFTIVVLTACQQGNPSEVLRDPESPLGPDEIETTDEGYTQTNNPGPRTFGRNGESHDIIEDKKTIKKAAERMPDVQVVSVAIMENEAHVTVKVSTPLSSNERKDLQANIKSAIEAVTQEYEIKITTES